MATGRRLLALLLLALAVPACHDGDDDDDPNGGGPAPAPQGTSLNAVLGGAQEIPPLLSPGSGTASFFIPDDRSRVDFSLNVSDLPGATGAVVALGEVGESGPALFVLSATPFIGPLQGTLRPDDLLPGGATGFGAALDALLAGAAFVEVPTSTFPAGEIRGQIGPARVTGALAAPGLFPRSPASGFATFTLNALQNQIAFTLSAGGLVGSPTGASLRVDAGGPVLFDLSRTFFVSPLTGTLAAPDLQPLPGLDIADFDDAVNALLGGRLFLTVSTTAFPAGEIGGPVGPEVLDAALAGVFQVPPVLTPATGSLTLLPDAAAGRLDFTLELLDLTSAPLFAQIRAGAPGFNGPTLFTLSSGPFGSPLSGTLTAADLQPDPALGVVSFDDALILLQSGNAHVVVATTANPAGEIRGQIAP